METVHSNEGPGKLIKINEEELRSRLNQLVLKRVEDVLNGLLDTEAGHAVGGANLFMSVKL